MESVVLDFFPHMIFVTSVVVEKTGRDGGGGVAENGEDRAMA